MKLYWDVFERVHPFLFGMCVHLYKQRLNPERYFSMPFLFPAMIDRPLSFFITDLRWIEINYKVSNNTIILGRYGYTNKPIKNNR